MLFAGVLIVDTASKEIEKIVRVPGFPYLLFLMTKFTCVTYIKRRIFKRKAFGELRFSKKYAMNLKRFIYLILRKACPNEAWNLYLLIDNVYINSMGP